MLSDYTLSTRLEQVAMLRPDGRDKNGSVLLVTENSKPRLHSCDGINAGSSIDLRRRAKRRPASNKNLSRLASASSAWPVSYGDVMGQNFC
jgi:hypothetical protein